MTYEELAALAAQEKANAKAPVQETSPKAVAQAQKAADETTEQHTVVNENGFYAKQDATTGHGTYNSLTKDGLFVGGKDKNFGLYVDNEGNIDTTGNATVAGEVKANAANLGGVEIGGGNINAQTASIENLGVSNNISAKTATIENLGVSNNIFAKLGTIGDVGLENGNVAAKTVSVANKTYIDANGLNANSQKVTNVADGDVSETSKDAVNGSQLHKGLAKATTEVTTADGEKNLSVKDTTGKAGQHVYEVSMSRDLDIDTIKGADGKFTLAKDGTLLAQSGTAQLYVTNGSASLKSSASTVNVADGSVTLQEGYLKNTAKLDTKGLTISDRNGKKTVINGDTITTNKVTGLADGTADSDAVNVSQLNGAVAGVKGIVGSADFGRTNYAKGAENVTDAVYKVDSQVKNNTDSLDTLHNAGIIAGKTYVGLDDAGNASHLSIAIGQGSDAGTDYKNTVIGAGASTKGTSFATALGAGSSVHATASHSVALGALSAVQKSDMIWGIDGQKGVVSVGKSGANGFTRRIINVQDGQAETDAVTVRQLNKVSGNAATNKDEIDKLHKAGIRAGALGTNTECVVSMGYGNVGNGVKDSISINGNISTWNTKNQIALGGHTTYNGAMALGFGSASNVTNSVALGFGSVAVWDDVKNNKVQNVVSIGNSKTDTYRRLINVADGEDLHDAVTVGQMNAADTKVKNDVTASFDRKFTDLQNSLKASGNNSAANSTALADIKTSGITAGVVDGSGSVAISGKDSSGANKATITGTGIYGAVAIGPNTRIDWNGQNGWGMIAIGDGARVSQSFMGALVGAKSTLQDSMYAVGFGDNLTIQNSYAGTSIGNTANVIDSRFGTALGATSKVLGATNAVALGAGSVAAQDNTISVGRSKEDIQKYNAYVDKYNADMEQQHPGNPNYLLKKVDESNVMYRRITGVAAGKDANDAVIVSQFNGANNSSFLNTVSKIDWTKINVNKLNSLNWDNVSAPTGTFALNRMATMAIADAAAVERPDRVPGAAENGNSNTSGGITTTKDTVTIDRNVTVDGKATVGSLEVTGDSTFKGNATFEKGASMNNQKITNVADGAVEKDSKDAVNGGQLYTEQQARIDADNAISTQLGSLGTTVNKLDRRVDQVGAGAAALAALHPLDYDPLNKWDFAAGYGNYRGASAVAIGTYYRPNENTMLSVGGSFGSGENMVNAGVSFKFGDGRHDSVGTSRTAMAKTIDDLKSDNKSLADTVATQGKQLKEQDAKMKALEEKLQKLLDAQSTDKKDAPKAEEKAAPATDNK